MRKIKIVIFGAGALSKFLSNKIKNNVEIVAYIVSGAEGEIQGKPIISVGQLLGIEYDYVVIAFGNTIKGIEVLKSAGIPEEKIVGYANSGQTYEENVLQKLSVETFHKRVQDEKITEIFDLPQKNYYICGMNVRENSEVISQDFVREQTLNFLSEEIYRRNVEGAVAKIGVSSGVFASKINRLFPDRTCYLFDTFSGLPEKDKQKAISMGWGEKQYAEIEHGTNPDEVLGGMPYPEKCVIKCGVFRIRLISLSHLHL